MKFKKQKRKLQSFILGLSSLLGIVIFIVILMALAIWLDMSSEKPIQTTWTDDNYTVSSTFGENMTCKVTQWMDAMETRYTVVNCTAYFE